MKRAVLITMTAVLVVAHGEGAWADEECVFTSPSYSSPLEVPGLAIYQPVLGSYWLVRPPLSPQLFYAADENEEDPSPCLLAAATVSIDPYRLLVNFITPFELSITPAARTIAHWLPWPCPQVGVCLGFAGSAVAAVPPDVDNLDVAYYFTEYYFLTIVY